MRSAPAIPVVPVEPVVVPSNLPKVEGISFRKDWKWEVTDVSQIPRNYMMVNEVAINGVARAMKDKTNIPGIRVYPEQVVVKSRSRPWPLKAAAPRSRCHGVSPNAPGVPPGRGPGARTLYHPPNALSQQVLGATP